MKKIVRAAARDKAHMVVMGTHGHGLVGRALMGSVARRVVTDCTVPVLLVKQHGPRQCRTMAAAASR